MARNRKLTGVIKGRRIREMSREEDKLLLRFEDDSTMTVKTETKPDASVAGRVVQAVRQTEATLTLDFEDRSLFLISLPEPASCVLIRDGRHVLEYAD